jgi:hypothetical protein
MDWDTFCFASFESFSNCLCHFELELDFTDSDPMVASSDLFINLVTHSHNQSNPTP